MPVPAQPKPPGLLRVSCSAVLVPYNKPPSFSASLMKLQQLTANLRDWPDLEGIISYYGWPGKAPAGFTLTILRAPQSGEGGFARSYARAKTDEVSPL